MEIVYMMKDFRTSVDAISVVICFSLHALQECHLLCVRSNPCLEPLWCFHILGGEVRLQLACSLVESPYPTGTVDCSTFP